MVKRATPADVAEVVRDPQAAMYLLQHDTEIGLDLETGGLSPWRDPIAVVSMYGEQSGTTAVLHVRGRLTTALLDFLSRPKPLWIGHNVAQFDMQFLAVAGVDINAARYYDTLIGEQSTLVTGRRDVRVNLQDTTARRLGVHLKKGMGESSWMVPELSQEQLTYCLEDVFYLPKLMKAQLQKVEGTSQEKALAFEQRLFPIVARMTLNGLPIDADALNEWRKELVVKNMEARVTINDLLSPTLNVNSSMQIRRAYKERYDLDLDKADVEILMELSEHEGPIADSAQAILTSRRALKRNGFYDQDWWNKHVVNGKVHARFWQTSTDTFRFSSSDPNLQQIPRDGRKIFGGVPGHMVVAVDFSQLEVRVAAALARCSAMLEALDSGDIHTTSATYIYGVPADQVTKEMRRIAKAATFTLLFGGSASGLVRYAKLSGSHLEPTEAKRVVDAFFRGYRGLAAERQRAKNLSSSGMSVTIMLPNGAKRVLAPQVSSFGGPPAVPPSQILNSLVQGTTAIGLKYAIFEIARRGLIGNLAAQAMGADQIQIYGMVGATVHDEMVSVVPASYAQEYAAELADAMVTGMAEVLGDVKVGTEAKIGTHWS